MNGTNGHLNTLFTQAGATAPATGANARSASAPAETGSDATSFAAVLAGRQSETIAASTPKARPSPVPVQSPGQNTGQTPGQTPVQTPAPDTGAQTPADQLDGQATGAVDPSTQGFLDTTANTALTPPVAPAGSDTPLPGLPIQIDTAPIGTAPINTAPVNTAPVNSTAVYTGQADAGDISLGDSGAPGSEPQANENSAAPVIASIQAMGRDVLQPRSGQAVDLASTPTSSETTATVRPDAMTAHAGPAVASANSPVIVPEPSAGKPRQGKSADTSPNATKPVTSASAPVAADPTATPGGATAHTATARPDDPAFVSTRTGPDQTVAIAQITVNSATPKPAFVIDPAATAAGNAIPPTAPAVSSPPLATNDPGAQQTAAAQTNPVAANAVPPPATANSTPAQAPGSPPMPAIPGLAAVQPVEPQPVSPVSLTTPEMTQLAKTEPSLQPAASAKSQAGQPATLAAQPSGQAENSSAKSAAPVIAPPQAQSATGTSTPAPAVNVSAMQTAPAMTPLSPLRQAGQTSETVTQSAPGEQAAKRTAKSVANTANPVTAPLVKADASAASAPSATTPAATSTALPDLPHTTQLQQSPMAALLLGQEAAPAPLMAESASLASLDVDLTTGRVDGRGALERSGGEPARFTPQSATQLAAQITRKFNNGARVFDIRLDPAELGRVDVKLELSADQRVQAVLTAERPETLAELQRAARELERALNDAGLQLGENGLSFELGQQAGEGHADRDSQSGNPQDILGASLLNEDDGAREDQGLVSAYGFDLMRRDRIDMRI